MITEIKNIETAKKRFHIFPEIRFNTTNYSGINSLNLETYVQINEYLCCLRKKFDYRDDIKLNYVQLMQFVDSIQTDVNKLKKNFKPELYENSTVAGIYKIIE